MIQKRIDCYRTEEKIRIDGFLKERAWRRAARTEDFVDIVSGEKLRLRKWVKVLWDDDFLYVGFHIESPDVWGTIVKQDDIVYNDPDAEIFIDPDGDTLNYYEFEMNALNTRYEVFWPKPLYDIEKKRWLSFEEAGGNFKWDLVGIKHAVQIYGTLNYHDDVDRGWTAEVALPWSGMKDLTKGSLPPKPGDVWRINFYCQELEDLSKSVVYHYIWAPAGVVSCHVPSTWGYIKFYDKTV
ncbi:MAG: carbohydrate-binding family 9-like protein [Candidatus Brockarchaeota archaeon]|nr:carbohydrate-binding family 9-like protein [Candidatus Brockarchaeota archaeon]